MPDPRQVAAMMKYNEELKNAGVLVALDGLHPPAMGARVTFSGGKPEVIEGPFPDVQEALGGYWMIKVKSKAEAIEWAARCPASDNEVIEIRQVQEMADFSPEVRKARRGLPPRRAVVARMSAKRDIRGPRISPPGRLPGGSCGLQSSP
jgi:hypothetical protein